jgi:hypothetical protein
MPTIKKKKALDTTRSLETEAEGEKKIQWGPNNQVTKY